MNSPIKFKIFCPASYRLYIAITITLLLSAGCVRVPSDDALNADSLAKDWREQVRKNPNNPYEGYNYPADNDSDYNYPIKPLPRVPAKQPQRAAQQNRKTLPPIEDNDDSNYGKFPRYNPDDDNQAIDSKTFPLYLN